MMGTEMLRLIHATSANLWRSKFTDNREEDVVQHEGGVDQGHDDPLAGGAPVPGRQGSEAAEAAQQLHAIAHSEWDFGETE